MRLPLFHLLFSEILSPPPWCWQPAQWARGAGTATTEIDDTSSLKLAITAIGIHMKEEENMSVDCGLLVMVLHRFLTSDARKTSITWLNRSNAAGEVLLFSTEALYRLV